MFRSAEVAAAITPSDATNFTLGKCLGIYVGGAGAVVAIVGGVAITFAAVPVGTTLWVAATLVNSTSTTATNLVALY
jgi:hypothetical protein